MNGTSTSAKDKKIADIAKTLAELAGEPLERPTAPTPPTPPQNGARTKTRDYLVMAAAAVAVIGAVGAGVNGLVDLKLAPLQVELEKIREDIREIQRKLALDDARTKVGHDVEQPSPTRPTAPATSTPPPPLV